MEYMFHTPINLYLVYMTLYYNNEYPKWFQLNILNLWFSYCSFSAQDIWMKDLLLVPSICSSAESL